MDISTTTHALIESRSPLAYPLGFVAGVISSVGPCAVTRYAAIARSSSVASRPWRAIGIFVSGIVAMYALFGAASSLLAYTEAFGAIIYAALALIFIVWGIRTAWHVHDHEHEAGSLGKAFAYLSSPFKQFSRRIEARFGSTSLVSIFILGVASACTVSPCCAPFLGLTVAVAAQSHDPLFGSTLLSVFAVGHAVPLIGYGAMGAYLTTLGTRAPMLRHVTAVAFSALMIGTGIAYAIQV